MVKKIKRFGKDLARTAWSNDWFDWFMLGIFVFLGVVGGMVWSVLNAEFKG